MKRSDETKLSRLSQKQEAKALSPPELKTLRGLLGKKKVERDGPRKKKSKNASKVVASAASIPKLAVSPKQATKLADVDYHEVWMLTIQRLRILITFDDYSTIEFTYETEAELSRDFEAWTRLHSPGKN